MGLGKKESVLSRRPCSNCAAVITLSRRAAVKAAGTPWSVRKRTDMAEPAWVLRTRRIRTRRYRARGAAPVRPIDAIFELNGVSATGNSLPEDSNSSAAQLSQREYLQD